MIVFSLLFSFAETVWFVSHQFFWGRGGERCEVRDCASSVLFCKKLWGGSKEIRVIRHVVCDVTCDVSLFVTHVCGIAFTLLKVVLFVCCYVGWKKESWCVWLAISFFCSIF